MATTLMATLLHGYQQHASQLKGRRVWVACSAGRDSMALAYQIHQLYLQGKLPFAPQLIHVNHGLQPANDDWAKQVKTWANTHNISCQICHANLKGTDEQSARNGRYEAMAKLMEEGDVLMLAHHADDQAETLLMRLFNGAGVAGLSAMNEWTAKQVGGKTIQLWRPWLTVSRADITVYAKANNLPYIDDPTNFSTELVDDNSKSNNTRSWLRTQLMPVIVQKYPKAVANINRSAELLGNANNLLSQQADKLKKSVTNHTLTKRPYQQVLDIELLRQLTSSEQSLVVHTWLQGNKNDEPLPPNKQRVDDVIKLIKRTDNDHQTKIVWQGKHHYTVCRYRGQLYRLRYDWLVWLKKPIKAQTLILGDIGPESVDGHKCTDSLTNSQPTEKLVLTIKDDGNISWQVDLDSLKLDHAKRINVRALTREDKIMLTGHSVAKSGKKLLQDLAVPVWCRASLALVLADSKPVMLLLPTQTWVLS
ncbi:MAG: tRNA lysidine(34) synthetase TilS [Gammaproteobacteria bacterium]|nr:MAG: tRNA lysidine(34) synthetase TilS [Gammaproteobacteria bacterium]